MGSFLGNLVLLLVFAWVVRGLLSARELTWTRLLVAAAAGYSVGGGLAAGLLIDVTNVADRGAVDAQLRAAQASGLLAALSLPFQVIATMAAVVLFELVGPGTRARRGLRPVRPLRAVRRRVRIAGRMAQVSRIAARHGLAPLLGLTRRQAPTRDPAELARRARAALEDAGGMFVKLGQLLATRPDLLPADALAELGRLHAAARPLSRAEVEAAIAAEVGGVDAVFVEVDWEPLGSASIAQAHTARLRDGREVVVKVRRPGLAEVMERDLAIVGWLARSAQRRTTWGRTYEATALAEEFADTLRAELDFRVEARRGADIADALTRHPGVRAPQMIDEHTTERLLVMERLHGDTMSAAPRDRAADRARALADDLCASQVDAMLQGRRFHGDPHPGNVMLLADGTLGLIDFGITGKLDAFERSSMLQMLLAIKFG